MYVQLHKTVVPLVRVYRLGVMFFSDVVTEEIYQANLDGSGMTEFVNTSLEVVGAYH